MSYLPYNHNNQPLEPNSGVKMSSSNFETINLSPPESAPALLQHNMQPGGLYLQQQMLLSSQSPCNNQQYTQQGYYNNASFSNYQFTNPWHPTPQELSPPSQLSQLQLHQLQQQQQQQQQFQQLQQQQPSQQAEHYQLQLQQQNNELPSFWGNSQSIWSSSNRQSKTGSQGFGDVSLTRGSIGRESFSSTSSDPPQIFDMSFDIPQSINNRAFEMGYRRHSYGGDIKHVPIDRISPRFKSISISTNSTNSNIEQKANAKIKSNNNNINSNSNKNTKYSYDSAVYDYFNKDPHERVQVTQRVLFNKFMEERQYLHESYQLPNFPIENTLKSYQLILVGFKAGRIDVFYVSKTPNESWSEDLKVHDLVIVEADRGKDLGQVLKLDISIDEARLLKLLQFQEQQAALSDLDSSSSFEATLSIKNLHQNTNLPSLHFPKPIIGLASSYEISQILHKMQDEEKACRLCLAKISTTTSIGQSDLNQMKLIDAEYQFDRKKLIFYYSTSKRIDFRDLVRELFKIYKTRIWMCAVIGLPFVIDKPEPQQKSVALDSKSNDQHSQNLQSPPQSNLGQFSRNTCQTPTKNRFNQHHQKYFQNGSDINYQEVMPEKQYGLDGKFAYPNHELVEELDENKGVYNIPRKFNGLEQISEQKQGIESTLVLKSLVDSIEH